MEGAKDQPNKDLKDYDDLPKDEVERKDGIPTITELRELFKEVFTGNNQPQTPSVSINIGFGNGIDNIGKTIDKLQGKPYHQQGRKERPKLGKKLAQ